jgi:hypothetical protein
MQRTLICVAWSDGRWRVTEAGPRNSISCFGERRDALDYATRLAEGTRDSTLLVRKRKLEFCGSSEVVRNARPLDCNPVSAHTRVPRCRLTVRSSYLRSK